MKRHFPLRRYGLLAAIPYALWLSLLSILVLVALSAAGAFPVWWSVVPVGLVIRLGGFELMIWRCGLLVTDEAVHIRTLPNQEALVIPVERIVAYRAYPDGRIEIAYLDSFEEPVEVHTFSTSVAVADPAAALDELRFRYGSDSLDNSPEAGTHQQPPDE